MKVGIPAESNDGLNAQVGEHFGRVPVYVVFDSETDEVDILDNTSEHLGGAGYPAEILHRAGINVMLCSGIGSRAIQMFEEMGIAIYVGANGTVQSTVDMWKNGKLNLATDESACSEHAYHGEGGGHGDHDHEHDGHRKD